MDRTMPPSSNLPKRRRVRRVMYKRGAHGQRRSEKAVQAAARKAEARRERRKLFRMAQRNELVLTERYRAVIRAQTLDNCRWNITVIYCALPDILNLKRARNEAYVRLINANVAIMVLQKINEIFAQHTLPMNVSLERSQENIRSQIWDIYALFCDTYRFDVNESKILERKFSRFSRDFFATPLLVGGGDSASKDTGNNAHKTANDSAAPPPAAVPDADNETIESVTMQRNNLIGIIEQEEIRTIAAQQTLQEKIDAVDAKIAELTLRLSQLRCNVPLSIK